MSYKCIVSSHLILLIHYCLFFIPVSTDSEVYRGVRPEQLARADVRELYSGEGPESASPTGRDPGPVGLLHMGQTGRSGQSEGMASADLLPQCLYTVTNTGQTTAEVSSVYRQTQTLIFFTFTKCLEFKM